MEITFPDTVDCCVTLNVINSFVANNNKKSNLAIFVILYFIVRLGGRGKSEGGDLELEVVFL